LLHYNPFVWDKLSKSLESFKHIFSQVFYIFGVQAHANTVLPTMLGHLFCLHILEEGQCWDWALDNFFAQTTLVWFSLVCCFRHYDIGYVGRQPTGRIQLAFCLQEGHLKVIILSAEELAYHREDISANRKTGMVM
jgi:hypothetical protein